MKLTGERPMQGATPDSLLALHDAGYREVAVRVGTGLVLDVGCVVGDETARLDGADRTVVGVDYSAQTAREAAVEWGPGGPQGKQVRFAAMDGARLGLQEGVVDWACSSHIIEHFTNPALHVAELARVLAPDGTAFVITPNAPADFENPFHVYLFEPSHLRSLLSLFFSDVQVLGLEGDDELHADFAQRRASGERLLKLDVLKLRRRLPRRVYVLAYERLLPLVYRVLGSKSTGIGSGLDASHLFLTEEIETTTPVLFAIARAPRPERQRRIVTMRVFVSVPTYREAENIDPLLRRLRAAVPDAHILVIDDNSPDGTADAAEKLALELGDIEVLRRPGKMGLGAAYRAGHAIGLARGYDVMVQIDADLSHQPEALPSLLEAVRDGAELALGSRYVEGGAIPHWPVYRLALSRWGCRYVKWALGIGVADSTAGYRAYRASALRTIQFDTTRANGYTFQIEMTYRLVSAGGRVTEVPITFTDRERGTSKMSSRIVIEAMALVTWWGVRDRLLRRRSTGGDRDRDARADREGSTGSAGAISGSTDSGRSRRLPSSSPTSATGPTPSPVPTRRGYRSSTSA